MKKSGCWLNTALHTCWDITTNMALYLKYRPQSLDELIGQEHVKKTLLGAFESGKLAHAYLFVGPRGTGKTSTARILAKMVNCEGKKVPCNECAVCVSITDGSNLDLIEIDAASNRGIDDIRSLRENIKLSPSSCKKKVYIIDEVHMLTTEAFNALLKTLEEPPAHVLFILATTEVAKVPQTILSRVQKLDFKLANAAELTQALENIAVKEKIELEGDAVKMLVSKAEGSFRDGVKLLDQVSSGKSKVSEQEVLRDLSGVLSLDLAKLLELISGHDMKGAINFLHQLVSNGSDPRAITVALIGALRERTLSKINSDERDGLMEISGAINALHSSLEKLKYTPIASLPLELAIIEISQDLKLEVGSSRVENQTSSDDVVSVDVASLQEKWNFVLESIKPYNFSLEALLRLVKILECNAGRVVLEAPYSFHQRILEAPKSRDLLESVLSEVLGKPTKVSCVVASAPLRSEDVLSVGIAADDEIIKAASEIFSLESN